MFGFARAADELVTTWVLLTVFGAAFATAVTTSTPAVPPAEDLVVASVEPSRWVELAPAPPVAATPPALPALPTVATVRVAPPPAPEPVVTATVAEPSEPTPEPARQTRPVRRRCEQPSDPAIVAGGDGSFTIERSVVHRYTRDLSALRKLGWSRVHADASGRSDGFEIGGVRCGSDLFDAGFRNGDVIHSVNGRTVRNVPQAILLYGRLRSERQFEIEITRRGERRMLKYWLTD